MPKLRAGLVAPFLMLAGCTAPEGPQVAVSGNVTYQGKPVDGATIFFTPDVDKSGRGAFGLIVGGRYSIPAADGPLPGEFNVQIVPPLPKKDAAGRDLPDHQIIPEPYQRMGNLRVKIPSRKSYSFDIALKDPR